MSTMEVTREIRAICAKARNLEYTRAKAAGEPRNEDAEILRGLEAVFAHLAAREADGVPFDIEAAASEFIEEGCEGESGTAYPSKPAAWFITQFANSLPALYAAQEAAAPAEVTDEMVERAAKGMWDSVPRGIEWPGATESISRDWRFLARAALNAITAPDLSDRYRAVMEAQGRVTDAMLKAAINAYHSESIVLDFAGESRMRSALTAALAAHPHTGHSAVPEGDK